MVVTRFAPSPTGNLHIGGVRTALFNWLYARMNKGRFILRIEDTDRQRSKQEYLESILSSLQWLGLDHDELLYQSARNNRYLEVIEHLLSGDKAYRDDGVVRLNVRASGKYTTLNDQVYGEIKTDDALMNDVVLLRSNGTATYNLAVVVDDYDSGVTDIIRGSDHITNTAVQIKIYESLGWKQPTYSHIPLIHNELGRKLSKRDGVVSVMQYRDLGFLPEALLSYLVRLGWSFSQDHMLSLEEMLQVFDLKGLQKSPACFDMEKLLSVNRQCIVNLPIMDKVNIMKEYGALSTDDMLRDSIILFEIRVNTLVSLYESLKFLWDDSYLKNISFSGQELRLLHEFYRLYSDIQGTEDDIKQIIADMILSTQSKKKEVYMMLRKVVTGIEESPPIIRLLIILGKTRFKEKYQKIV